jgi:cytidylate kinase
MERVMSRKISIAIDGPAGAGKTTIAREVSRILGLKYVDTGAMYRAVAWKMLKLGIPLSDEEAIVDMARNMDIDFAEGDGSKIFVDGRDISREIRTPEVTKYSSPVSAIPGVRRILVARQRELAGSSGVVMEGRDIGSVVLPDAQVKIFLTASAVERARRRCKEMQAAGMDVNIEKLRLDIEERDHRDSTRADSPLVQATGAVAVNTDKLSIDEVVKCILDISSERINAECSTG